MSDQDAVRRPSPFTQTSSSSVGQLPSPSYTSSPRTPLGRKQTVESGRASNDLHSPLQVGESIQASKDSLGGRTNDSIRNLRGSRGMSISQGLQGDLTSDGVSRKQTVRRKPVPREESAGLSYIAESQAQLGFVSVSLWMENTPASDFLSYQVDISNSQVLVVSHDGVSHSVALPCQVVHGQEGSVAQLQDHWQVKLQMEQTPARARGVMHARQAAAPLSASTLQDMRPSQFVCDSCLQTVAETGSITQYLPLPSQHWEELVDAWMCHTDQELSQGMIDTQKKLDEHRGLQGGQARVADSFIVIHPSQLVAAGTHEDVQVSTLFRGRVFGLARRSAPLPCIGIPIGVSTPSSFETGCQWTVRREPLRGEGGPVSILRVLDFISSRNTCSEERLISNRSLRGGTLITPLFAFSLHSAFTAMPARVS